MNYALHNKELHGTLLKTDEPVIFLKPDTALLSGGRPFFVPDHLGRVDYEAELVVRICRLGKGVPERFAHRYYDAATLGIDFTARDLQKRLSQAGRPWDVAKGFDGSACIGQWVELAQLPSVQQLRFRLEVNGQVAQQGNTVQMLRSVDALISHISQFYTLRTGDLLFTGTPAGVGAVHPDDRLEGWLESHHVLSMNCK